MSELSSKYLGVNEARSPVEASILGVEPIVTYFLHNAQDQLICQLVHKEGFFFVKYDNVGRHVIQYGVYLLRLSLTVFLLKEEFNFFDVEVIAVKLVKGEHYDVILKNRKKLGIASCISSDDKVKGVD